MAFPAARRHARYPLCPCVDHSQLRSVAEPVATSVAAHELYALAPLAETAEGLQVVAAGEGHRLYVLCLYMHFTQLYRWTDAQPVQANYADAH